MARITWGIAKDGQETDQLARWVADHIWPGKGRDFGNCRGMAVIEGETLIGGAIWHNFDADAGVVELSAAATSKRWLTRETLDVMFGVPFRDWGCQATVFRISPEDEPMHRMLAAYGGELFVLPRLRGRHADEHVFIVTDDAWKSNKFNVKAGSPAGKV